MLQGSEFISLKSWLASEGCLLTYKYLNNKANFSEHGIFLVKNRLFKLLRYKLSDNWVKYLPYVVAALNKRSLKRIGFLRPDDIHSEFDNIKVQEALKKNHQETFSEPDWRTQQKLQEQYEKSSKNKFQVGTFVYLDEPQNVFQKSFHVQVIFSYETKNKENYITKITKKFKVFWLHRVHSPLVPLARQNLLQTLPGPISVAIMPLVETLQKLCNATQSFYWCAENILTHGCNINIQQHDFLFILERTNFCH